MRCGMCSFAEKVVLCHFLVMVGLWFTRSPGIFTGWSVLFTKGCVTSGLCFLSSADREVGLGGYSFQTVHL